jgi:hypothetical protein
MPDAADVLLDRQWAVPLMIHCAATYLPDGALLLDGGITLAPSASKWKSGQSRSAQLPCSEPDLAPLSLKGLQETYLIRLWQPEVRSLC